MYFKPLPNCCSLVKAKVIASPDCDNKFDIAAAETGDTILFPRNHGTEVTIDGTKYLLVQESSIVLIEKE